MWIMSCVNFDASTLSIGEHINISFDKTDVGHVFGIPSSGKSWMNARPNSRESKEFVLKHFLGSKFKEQRSIKCLQEIIEREYTYPMSKEDEHSFMVAFVVFVVSILLAPSSKHDYASIDYWSAIHDPDLIYTYDWAKYVILRLLEGARKLKEDMETNIKFPMLTGCSLFLQVLYLDSIEIDGISLNHKTRPRIRDFSSDNLRAMIQADRNFARHFSPEDDIAPHQLRNPLGCVYSWALNRSSAWKDSRGGCLLAIWEVAVAMVHLLNIPLEAAGPVFVAAADFQHQVNSGLVVSGTQALKFMTVLVSIMIPYSRGFRYQHAHGSDSGCTSLDNEIANGISLIIDPGRFKGNGHTTSLTGHPSNCFEFQNDTGPSSSDGSHANQETSFLECTDIGDPTQKSFSDVICSLDDMPHYLNVNLRVATAMSQFYSLLRRLKPSTGLDLNTFAVEGNMVCCPLDTPSVSSVSDLPSPWSLGRSASSDFHQLNHETFNLDCLCGYEGLVIVHRDPRYIQVSGMDMRAQLLGNCEMELDMFDALIRSLKQVDDELYISYGSSRWRHFLESDFMDGILSGSFDPMDINIRNHLSLRNNSYELNQSKLIFFPALLQCSWVCFVWALRDNVIYVFEPSYSSPVPHSRLALIERSCDLLKIVLHTLSGVVFKGVSHHSTSPVSRLLTLPDGSFHRLNRSGLLCYMFCCGFDGVDLLPRLSMVHSDCVVAKLLNDVIRLKYNSGKFPKAQMATPVYCWPLHLLGGVYADLHGGNVIQDGFGRLATCLDDDGERGEQVTYLFDFETPLVPGGRINLSVTGQICTGGAEAERTAVIAMVDAVREHYNYFPADYNYIFVAENRVLYNLMRTSLGNVKRTYSNMELLANEAHSSMLNLNMKLSAWLAHPRESIQASETIAVSALQCIMTEKADQLGATLMHSASLIQMLTRRDNEPDEQRRFDRTVPMPQPIQWDRSYYTLRCVYEQAVKKLPGPVSTVKTEDMPDGQMQGVVYLAAEPFVFRGPPASSKAAAKAKLCYIVIKYVNLELGFPILDINHPVRCHQVNFINKFDRKIKGIYRCAEKMKAMLDDITAVFNSAVAELKPRLSRTNYTHSVYQSIQLFSSKLMSVNHRFNSAVGILEEAKVDRATLESLLTPTNSG